MTKTFSFDPRRLAGFFCLSIAFALSLFLGWKSWSGLAIPGCAAGGACHEVLSSRWGGLFGIPVGLVGAAAYGFTILAAAKGWRRCLCVGALAIVCAALWFTAVQGFALKKFCPWCCVTHAMALLGAILLARVTSLATPEKKMGVFRPEFVLAILGVFAFALLQTLTTPPERALTIDMTTRLERIDNVVSLYDDAFSFDASQLPHLGVLNSEKTAIALTDYSCPHCRELHRLLSEAEAEFAGRLNVVFLPAFRNKEAREVHRILLTLWKAEPAYFEQIEESLIQERLQPDAKELLAEAQEYFQGHFYEIAWVHGPWVEEQLKQTASLLTKNDQKLTTPSLPQFMLGDRLLQGAPRIETIRALLHDIDSEIADAPRPQRTPPPPASIPSAARIEFETTTLELPQVVKGEKATGKFVFKNLGSDPLEIINIKVSCGCTTVDGWKQSVAPGETGSFEVALDTSRFVGKVSKSIDVTTNANNTPGGVIKLTIQADVWSPVRMSRYSASFGTLLKGEPREPMRIPITVVNDEPLMLGEPTSSNVAFKTTFETLEPGRRYELSITPPAIEEGVEQGVITLPVGHPKLQKIDLPAYVRVADGVEATPKALLLPGSPSNAKSTRILTLICHDRAFPKLTIEAASIQNADGFEAVTKASSSPRMAQIEVTTPDAFDPKTLAGKNAFVVIKTNHPKYPEIQVPIEAQAPVRAATQG